MVRLDVYLFNIVMMCKFAFCILSLLQKELNVSLFVDLSSKVVKSEEIQRNPSNDVRKVISECCHG